MRQKQVDVGLAVAGESLQVLCRTFPASQLNVLAENITDLLKRSEAAARSSDQNIRSIQETFLQRFNGERHQRVQGSNPPGGFLTEL